MAHVDFVVNSNIYLVGIWNDICLQFSSEMKKNNEGSKHVNQPICYSCPEYQVICPVLALSKHLLCIPRILLGKCKLYEGLNQYERFNSILCLIFLSDEHHDAFIDIGVQPKYFGTHSMQKGEESRVVCGTTSGTTKASICMRANWHMSVVVN